MGTNSLYARNAGDIAIASFWNDFLNAFCGDFVGRDASTYVPASGQKLGNAAYPWGDLRCGNIISNGVSLDLSGLPNAPYRMVSGKTRSTSNQPAFIQVPTPAAQSFKILASSTNLTFVANGVTYEWTADQTKSAGLTVAPSTNNTASMGASGGHDDGSWNVSNLTISGAGSAITALVGQWCAFKIGTEYFIGFLESTTSITNCFRGFFYDSSANPINPTTFSNAATLTLMSLGWVFIDGDGLTIDVAFGGSTNAATYVGPSQPYAASGTQKYWFDTVNKEWKQDISSNWTVVNRTLCGFVVLDTANVVGARCIDFSADFRDTCRMNLALDGTSPNTIVAGQGLFQHVNVHGTLISYDTRRPKWDNTANLAPAADMYTSTLQPSTTYYLYLSDRGETYISDITPYFRRDLFGWYHPHNPWRAIGKCATDGSSHWSSTTLGSYGELDGSFLGHASIPGSKLQAGTVTNDKIATGTIIHGNMQILIPHNSGQVTQTGLTSTSFANVTGLSTSITPQGSVVMLFGLTGTVSLQTTAAHGTCLFQVVNTHTSTVVGFGFWGISNGSVYVDVPFSIVCQDLAPTPGVSNTYQLQYKVDSASTNVSFQSCTLGAFEI